METVKVVAEPEQFKVQNSSRAKKVARRLYGPRARIWNRDGQFLIGAESSTGVKSIYVREATLDQAVEVAITVALEDLKEQGQKVKVVEKDPLTLEFDQGSLVGRLMKDLAAQAVINPVILKVFDTNGSDQDS